MKCLFDVNVLFDLPPLRIDLRHVDFSNACLTLSTFEMFSETKSSSFELFSFLLVGRC